MTDARFNGIARILKENMNKSVANGTFEWVVNLQK